MIQTYYTANKGTHNMCVWSYLQSQGDTADQERWCSGSEDANSEAYWGTVAFSPSFPSLHSPPEKTLHTHINITITIFRMHNYLA